PSGFGRGEPQQPPARSAALVLDDPDRAVRSLLYGPNPLAHREALRFARLFAVDLDAHERLRRQSADERVALPRWKLAARVEHQARRRDHRVPERGGRSEIRPRVVVGDPAAVVVIAVRDQRIAVVRAAPDEVQLVAAARTHLNVPEPPFAVERETERIPVPQGPDLRGDAALLGERIVLGHGAVIVEAHDLAEVRPHVLCGIELLALAGADPQIAVAERDPVTVVPVARDLRLLPPDHLEILERAAALGVEHEARAGDRGAARAALAGFRVAQVCEPVLVEVRMQHDVAEPALPAVRDLRHALDIERRARFRREELEGAALLADEQAAVRQEFHRPRLGELRDLLRLERAVLREHPVVTGAAGGDQHRAGENSRPPDHRPAPSHQRMAHGPPSSGCGFPAAALCPGRPARAGPKLRLISPATAAACAATAAADEATSSRSTPARNRRSASSNARSRFSRCIRSSRRNSAQSVTSQAPAPARTAHAAATGPPGAHTAAPLAAAAPTREAPRAAVRAAAARPPRTAAARARAGAATAPTPAAAAPKDIRVPKACLSRCTVSARKSSSTRRGRAASAASGAGTRRGASRRSTS